jgi:predicted adenine nucleotide alpha hydrolase (AANH) superfamily ATPase
MGKVNVMKENYQKILDETIAGLEEKGEVPKLLLHSCCAPCSSYVLEYLSNYFYITVLYYNPNIYPEDEYYHRAAEQKRFIKEFPTKYPVTFVEGNFEPERFYETVKGYENIREGGERCFRCYELRLREAAEYAKKINCDYFTTTLSISPMKNAVKLNEIGGRLAEEYGIPYLYSDFKKRDGYKRSTVISAEYGMYRQDYCGCVFSKREREEQKRERAAQESEQAVQE